MALDRFVTGACCLLIVLFSGSVGLGQTLTNASFESGTAGWETFGGGWRTSSWSNETDSDVHSGNVGLVNDVSENDKEEWRGVSQAVEAKHGMLYSGAVWVKALKAKQAECCLEFQFLDDNGKVLLFKQSDPVTADQPFMRIEIEPINPPKGTEMLAVRGIVHMTKKPDGETDFFVFDDFELSVTNKSSKSSSDSRKNLSPADRIRERQKARGMNP